MTYNQRILLRRLLPAVFWLLALGGSIGIPFLLAYINQQPAANPNYWWGFLVAAFVLTAIIVAKRIDRHQTYVHQMFLIAALLGLASYWLPTIVTLILPFGIYAAWKATANFKAFLAIIIAFAMDTLYAAIFIYLGWINNVWEHILEPDYQWGWIPVAAILTAWLASTIARLLLRER